MELQQLTDEQLKRRLNYLGHELLDTSQSDHNWQITAARFDAVQEELESRGLW